MKLNLISLAVLAALGASTNASALDFAFDPTGGGSTAISNAALIDQLPGNGLAQGGVTAINNYFGGGSTAFTTYYQANLNSVNTSGGSNLFANGTGGNYFTFTAGFGETVNSAAVVGNTGFANFAFDASNPVNFFNMYATNALGTDLTGAGFASGTSILSGHIVSITSSNFTSNLNSSVNLDQSLNGNQWGGQQTVTGSGSTDMTIRIDAANAGYFPDLPVGTEIVLTMFNNSQVDPFSQVDPSRCFNTGTTCTAGGYNPVIGAINGLSGPDFIFQADANQGFTTVPEPGSLALLGLGFSLMGLRSIRRRRTVA